MRRYMHWFSPGRILGQAPTCPETGQPSAAGGFLRRPVGERRQQTRRAVTPRGEAMAVGLGCDRPRRTARR